MIAFPLPMYLAVRMLALLLSLPIEDTMDQKLKNKTAIVTGASGGQGAAEARSVRAGWRPRDPG